MAQNFMDFAMISQKIKVGDNSKLQKTWEVGRERELELFNGDTEEWEDAQQKYERLTGDLERQISLIICFGQMKVRLIDWGEGRGVMQMSQELKQAGINKNMPTILGAAENEEKIGDLGGN